MFDALRAYFKDRFTEEEFRYMEPMFAHRHLKKGEFLSREGEVARYGAFVVKGCLRSYVVDNKGKEHVIQFAPENWWLSDMHSMLHNEPSLYFMDALEPTDVLLIDMPSHKKLMENIPSFNAAFQSGRQKHTTAKDNRIIATLTTTAEERYESFLQTYPTIAQRVPQHMLASYLGITPETLSRIRKKQSVKK